MKNKFKYLIKLSQSHVRVQKPSRGNIKHSSRSPHVSEEVVSDRIVAAHRSEAHDQKNPMNNKSIPIFSLLSNSISLFYKNHIRIA